MPIPSNLRLFTPAMASLMTSALPRISLQLKKLSLFNEYTGMTDTVKNAASQEPYLVKKRHSPCQLLPPRFPPPTSTRFVHGFNSPIHSINPSETYRDLGVELNTVLKFTKHWQGLKRTTTTFINALSTCLLTQSRRFRVIQ
jgi:hypothetical protein